MTVDTGMDAAFTCAWTGNPPLTLAWTKQGSIAVRHQTPLTAVPALCVIFCSAAVFLARRRIPETETRSLFDQLSPVIVA